MRYAAKSFAAALMHQDQNRIKVKIVTISKDRSSSGTCGEPGHAESRAVLPTYDPRCSSGVRRAMSPVTGERQARDRVMEAAAGRISAAAVRASVSDCERGSSMQAFQSTARAIQRQGPSNPADRCLIALRDTLLAQSDPDGVPEPYGSPAFELTAPIGDFARRAIVDRMLALPPGTARALPQQPITPVCQRQCRNAPRARPALQRATARRAGG